MRGKRRTVGDPAGGASGRRGSGLIVVLWVVGILSMLVVSFAFDAHVEARITSYYRKRTKANYLAVGGLEVAKMLMSGSAGLGKGHEKTEEDAKDAWYDQKKRLAEGLAVQDLTHALGDGAITLSIEPEPARRNVNLLGEEDWDRVLDVGGVPQSAWPELVDSVNDWLDNDSEPRADGAESETYYETLDPPYRAKDGPLDTVEELLLVKGFSRLILSGGVIKASSDAEEDVRLSGIGDLLTTYGDGRVNVNAASQRVLMTLPGVDELVAGAIIEEREGRLKKSERGENYSFSSVDDFMSRIPGIDPAVRGYVTTDSAIYRITSTGTVQGVRRQVWCIARYAGGNLTVLRWREEEE